jgi:hypothetical protein
MKSVAKVSVLTLADLIHQSKQGERHDTLASPDWEDEEKE